MLFISGRIFVIYSVCPRFIVCYITKTEYLIPTGGRKQEITTWFPAFLFDRGAYSSPTLAKPATPLCTCQIGTVERALEIFRQLGLVEQLDSGLLYMTDIELMIGQSSTEAERKRAARLENRALLPPRTNGGHLSDIRPPEIEIKKEIDIEIEKERELETGHPAAYGRYSNVFLSDKELAELKRELPGKWEYYIDRLSCHIASSGKKYRSHAATIYKWSQEDAAKGALKKGIPDYTCKEGESL